MRLMLKMGWAISIFFALLLGAAAAGNAPVSVGINIAKIIIGRKLRPEDIEDMIKSRLKERNWAVEQMPASDGLWPVACGLLSG